jgi:DegV family protein with EDD domain
MTDLLRVLRRIPMSKIAIVTDSTANIPPELIKNYPVFIAPLQVIWDEKSYLDGIDIKPADFYNRLSHSTTIPSTSQVTPANFMTLYEDLIREDYQIISIHISQKLSGTLDSATQAKDQFPGARIELFDSATTSMSMGFQVLAVARAASLGASLDECLAVARKAREHTGVFFMASTLEFLHRGGRIGGAARFLGTALDLKPIMEVRDGRIEAVERVRSINKAIDRMVELAVRRIESRSPIRLSAIHANDPDSAAILLEKVRARFTITEVSETIISEISPVLGTHTGPGTVGIAFMAGM